MSEAKNQKHLGIYKELTGESRQDYFDLQSENPKLQAHMVEQDHGEAIDREASVAQNRSDWLAYQYEKEQQAKLSGEIIDTALELLHAHPHVYKEFEAVVGQCRGGYGDKEVEYRLVQTFPRGENTVLAIEMPYEEPEEFDLDETLERDDMQWERHNLRKIQASQRVKQDKTSIVRVGENFTFYHDRFGENKPTGTHELLLDYEDRKGDSYAELRRIEHEVVLSHHTLHAPELPKFIGYALDETFTSSRDIRKLLKMIKNGTPIEPEVPEGERE